MNGNDRDVGRLANKISDRARSYSRENKHDAAALTYRALLTLCEGPHRPASLDAANVRDKLADVYRKLGTKDVPKPFSESELANKQTERDADALQDAIALEAQAAGHAEAGRHEEAAALLEHALSIKDKLHLEHDLDAEAFDKLAVHSELPDTAVKLAAQYQALGRYDDAEPLLKRALTMIETAFDPEDVKFGKAAVPHNALGALYEAQGRYGDAERHFEIVVSILEDLGFGSSNLSGALENLARVHVQQGHYDAAEPLLSRSLEMREEGLGRYHPSVAVTLSKLADLYRATGRPEEAEPLLKRLETIRKPEAGSNDGKARDNATE